MQLRKQKRLFAAKTLSDLHSMFEEQPEYLTHFRDMVMAALKLAQQEILWYFLHVNEVSFLGHKRPKYRIF